MKNIFRKIRTNRKASILAVAIFLVAGITLAQTGSEAPTQDDLPSASASQEVVLYDVSTARGNGSITADGEVTSRAQASLTTEATGVIREVHAEIGDRVSGGQRLISLSADDERAALDQADAGLQSQQARLDELVAGTRPAELGNTQQSVETAQTNLEQARQDLLNTDLQAYLQDERTTVSRGSLQPPMISGAYEGIEEGEYRIDLYRSGTQSGYSFRYSGLEKGVARVSTEVPQPLGDRGLYIQFPDDFADTLDLEWEVSIPNKRSPQHAQARSNLRRAEQSLRQAENNLSLATEGPRSEQIQAQQAAVAQAAAGVASARSQLAKKTIRAPFAGIVSALTADVGELVSPGSTLVEVVNADELMISTYLSAGAARSVRTGDVVLIQDGIQGEVAAVSPAVSTDAGTVEVIIRVLGDAGQLLVGDYVSLEIMTASSDAAGTPVPLAAVRNDTQGAYVLEIKDGAASRVAVETGSVRGESVIVTDGLADVSAIIANARSVSIGDEVTEQQ